MRTVVDTEPKSRLQKEWFANKEQTKLVTAFETYAAQHNERLEDINIYRSPFRETKSFF